MINFCNLQSTAAACAIGHDFSKWLAEDSAELENQIHRQLCERRTRLDRKLMAGRLNQGDYDASWRLIHKLAEDHNETRRAILASATPEEPKQ